MKISVVLASKAVSAMASTLFIFLCEKATKGYDFDMYTIHAVIPKCVLETQKLVNVMDVCISSIMTLHIWQP